MKSNTVWTWIVVVVIAAASCLPLTFMSEGTAYQFGLQNGTPGIIVSRLYVTERGSAGVTKGMRVAFVVDVAFWFLASCGTGVLVVYWRNRIRKTREVQRRTGILALRKEGRRL